MSNNQQILNSFAVRFIESDKTLPIFVKDKETIKRLLNDFKWQVVRCYTREQLIEALTPHKP